MRYTSNRVLFDTVPRRKVPRNKIVLAGFVVCSTCGNNYASYIYAVGTRKINSKHTATVKLSKGVYINNTHSVTCGFRVLILVTETTCSSSFRVLEQKATSITADGSVPMNMTSTHAGYNRQLGYHQMNKYVPKFRPWHKELRVVSVSEV